MRARLLGIPQDLRLGDEVRRGADAVRVAGVPDRAAIGRGIEALRARQPPKDAPPYR